MALLSIGIHISIIDGIELSSTKFGGDSLSYDVHDKFYENWSVHSTFNTHEKVLMDMLQA
jgi:hypothetical protein